MRCAGVVAALFLLITALPARAVEQDTPIGLWMTQDRDAVIAIAPCEGFLCGRIVGVTLDHPDDQVPTAKDGRSQCGLTIIREAALDGNSGWSARITDPRDGSTYQARLQLDQQRNLRVRGFIGIPLLGRTQVWTRYAGPLPGDCRLLTQ